MTADVKNIIVADHHPLYRDHCSRLLANEFNKVEVSVADSVETLIRSALVCDNLNFILFGLNLPDTDNFSGFVELKSHLPNIPACIVSELGDTCYLKRALSLGAIGFIPKSLSVNDWKSAMSVMLDGVRWVPPRTQTEGTESPDGIAAIYGLSPVQTLVLNCLQRGLKNSQIANELGIKPPTAKHHVSRIIEKLGVSSRTQAVVATQDRALKADDWIERC